MKKDLKEALSSARKADITHVRKPLMNYIARACDYGSDRYERANFLRPVSPEPGVPTAADFNRLRAYLRAAASHIVETLDAMEQHQSQDFELVDVDGMKTAAFAEDTDEPPSGKVGASHLPHLAHAAASLNMALSQAVNAGLLPRDPGVTWSERKRPETANVYATSENGFITGRGLNGVSS